MSARRNAIREDAEVRGGPPQALPAARALWDERLTSAEANRLLRETELSIEKRAKAVDRMAAILILQGWMESRGCRSGACRSG